MFDVTQADLNWENKRVREELKNILRFWKEKGVKGFRFDVVNLISKPEVFCIVTGSWECKRITDGMPNAYYEDISMYRDVESLNYYQILLDEGKSKEEALEILSKRSRDNSRTPMQWDDTEYAGFSQHKPWLSISRNYKDINVKKQENDKDSILQYYKSLIGLRKEKKAISEGTITFRKEADDQVFVYQRNFQNQEIVVVCNWLEANHEVSIPGTYHTLLGNYTDCEQQFKNKVTLRPYECYILEK